MIQGYEVQLCYPVAGRRLILAELDGKFVIATIPAEGVPSEWEHGNYRSDPGAAASRYGARYAELTGLGLADG